MGKSYLADLFKADVAFMESFLLPSESDVKTEEDGENLLKLSFRVHAILGKFYKARKAYITTSETKDSASQTDFTPEIQVQTIQKLENEIKQLREGSTSQTQTQTIDNSDEWETVATTESSTAEPISRELMRDLIVKIHKLKSKLLAKEFKVLKETYGADFDFIVLLELPKAKLVELNEVEWKKLVAIDKKLEAMMSKFQNSKSPQNKLNENGDLSIPTTQSRDQYTDTEDLSFVNKQEIDAIQILRNEIFSQSESKVKPIFNLETALRNEIRDKNLSLKRVVDLEVKQDESCKQLKDKESEISTLKTQVEMLLSDYEMLLS